MRAAWGILLGVLWAQEGGIKRAALLLQQAEEAPDPDVENLARAALALLPPPRDSQIALYVGQALDLLGYGLAYRGHWDSAEIYSDSAFHLLKRFGHIAKAAEVRGNLAYYLHQQGKRIEALQAHAEVAQLAQTFHNIRLLFYTLNNLASLFSEIGLYDTAVVLYMQAIRLSDSLQDARLRATALHNIANLYEQQGLTHYARLYADQAHHLWISLNDSAQMAYTFLDLARLYQHEGKTDSALHAYRQAYQLALAAHNYPILSSTIVNLAGVYLQRKEWDSCRMYLEEALTLRRNSPPEERFRVYRMLVHLYQKWGEESPVLLRPTLHQKALFWLNEAEKIIETGAVQDPEQLSLFYEHAHMLYASLGDYRKAYIYHQSHIAYRDKLQNQKARQKALESHYQYAWLRREQSWREELLRQELQREAERRRWRMGIAILIIGLVGASGMVLLLLRLNRKLRLQEATIRTQKRALEESYQQIIQQHENLQSQLRYARRLQNVLMLPPALPFPSALWYQPCQEVGGDFYWSRITKEGHVLLGVGDCTGHGIAGSFMTVLSYTLLEEGVREGLVHPLFLLRYLHKAWGRLLQAGEEELHDGLQGTFLYIDGKGRRIEALPAGQYFWVVYQDGKVEEIAPTPPGIFGGTPADPSLWQVWSKEIPPQGLRIALASDGLTDQIGGPSRKKWGRKRWRALLSETVQLPPEQALSQIQTEWHTYRQPFSMVDDLTVWIIDLPPLSNQIS